MQKWLLVCGLLCMVGFFKELRPNKPFLTKFLTNYKGFTNEQVVQDIYAIGTYTHLLSLPVVFLVTDFSRYKPIIVLEIISFVSGFCILTWTNTLSTMQLFEFFYGIAASAEIAYYTYIYAKVDQECYKKVTSFTHSAIILGNLAAASSSQALISTDLMNYLQLNYLSIAFCILALIAALFLPNVGSSVYFSQIDTSLSQSKGGNDLLAVTTNTRKVRKAYAMLWRNTKFTYTKLSIMEWPIWLALLSVGSYQIKNYAQSLWESIIKESGEEPFHGAVEAVHTLSSAVLGILVSYLNLPKCLQWGGRFLILMSTVLGVLLLWLAFTRTLFLSYVAYVVYRIVYQLLFTLSSAGIAERVSQDSFGLTFGINRFLSLGIQTIITFVVTDTSTLGLDESYQFKVYGIYYLGVAIFIVLVGSTSLIKSAWDKRDNNISTY